MAADGVIRDVLAGGANANHTAYLIEAALLLGTAMPMLPLLQQAKRA